MLEACFILLFYSNDGCVLAVDTVYCARIIGLPRYDLCKVRL